MTLLWLWNINDNTIVDLGPSVMLKSLIYHVILHPPIFFLNDISKIKVISSSIYIYRHICPCGHLYKACHMYLKITFKLSCHWRLHINLTSFNRSHVLKNHFACPKGDLITQVWLHFFFTNCNTWPHSIFSRTSENVH
jgi:hypothetical protein